MKIRAGFVSNSSSASYTLTIRGISPNDFAERLDNEYGIEILSASKIKDAVQKKINDLAKSIKEYKSWGSQHQNQLYLQASIKACQKEQADYRKLLPNIQNMNDAGAIAALLLKKIYYIDVNYKKDDSIDISANTSMHNSFKDMPEIMHHMTVLFLDMELDVKLHTEHMG